MYSADSGLKESFINSGSESERKLESQENPSFSFQSHNESSRRAMSNSVQRPAKSYSFLQGAYEMVLKGQLNILLLAIPAAITVDNVQSTPPGAVFILSLLGIAPLAERLGYVTEQLAMHTNETVGGLLNVTFGNATELIVAVAALYHGKYRIVQLTLLGSVLSNLLLVLGSAFFFGGIYNPPLQEFGRLYADVNIPLLFIGATAVVYPTTLLSSPDMTEDGILSSSRCTSLILFFLYCIYLLFQLRTHYSLFSEEETGGNKDSLVDTVNNPLNTQAASTVGLDGDDSKTENELSDQIIKRKGSNEVKPSLKRASIAKSSFEIRSNSQNDGVSDGKPEEDEDLLGITYSLFWLLVITVLIALLSDSLVTTIESAASSVGISNVFLAAIVVPIVGNAAEHTSAVVFGVKNRLNLSLGIAIGSGTQIALFLFPLLVIIGWAANAPMNLDLEAFESTSLITTVILVAFIVKNRRSTWLDGVTLIGAYVMICGGFWTHSNESNL